MHGIEAGRLMDTIRLPCRHRPAVRWRSRSWTWAL